jgi:RNAse (barnase) inhibitor barstar
MKLKYSYKIIRYCPNKFTGEFTNIGLFLISEDKRYCNFKFLQNTNRIQKTFSSSTAENVRRLIIKLEKAFEEFRNNPSIFTESYTIDSIAGYIVPDFGLSLFFSETKSGIADNYEEIFNKYFELIVNRYSVDRRIDKNIGNARIIWNKYFRIYFEQNDLLRYIKKKEITIFKEHVLNFDYTWQNGSLNIFYPIKLGFKKNTNDDRKYVQNLLGLIPYLEAAKLDINLYYLSKFNEQYNENNAYYKEILNRQERQIKSEVIDGTSISDIIDNMLKYNN